MGDRTTWRLTLEQLCDLDLIAARHLGGLDRPMDAEEADLAAGPSRPGQAPRLPAPVVLDTDGPPPEGVLALLDAEGVELAALTPAVTSRRADGRTVVSGPLEVHQRPEHDALAELFVDSATLRDALASCTERLAVVVEGPPTLAATKALADVLEDSGTGLAVLLVATAPTLDDRGLAAALAWRTALESLPRSVLACLSTGHGHNPARRHFSIVAAATAGFTAVGVVEAARDGVEAALARAHGLAVRTVAAPALDGSELLVDGAEDALRPKFAPDVWEVVRRAHPPRAEQGVTLLFSGLSGAGKSTVARAVAARLPQLSSRRVTLLDGDVVRHHLSSGLGFSKADRETNVRRIGWVASEVTRHGGFAICAPIAPYAATRAEVRRLVERHGGFVLVHVATPLAECERRDRKGLYAQARRGAIPEFTGVSDPYEEPTDADLRIDTSGRSVEEMADTVVAHLRTAGYLRAG